MASQMATATRTRSEQQLHRTKTESDVASRAFGALVDSLDLKQIRCFVAAYEEGSFSKAALREHCTQPGLSVYIQRLERMLAHRLFERKARGVTPTIAGRHFYACCGDVLKTVSLAKQRMLDMAGNVATDINVGVSPTLFKGVLPWMLPDYLSAHPYVDVRLAEAYSGTLTDWVVSGEVQVAIVTKPPVHLGLETTHFFRDRLVLVTRGSGTRHKGRRARLRSSSELQELKLILPSPRHSLRQVIEAAAVRLGAKGSGRILEIDGMLDLWVHHVAADFFCPGRTQHRLVTGLFVGYVIRCTAWVRNWGVDRGFVGAQANDSRCLCSYHRDRQHLSVCQ